MGSTNKTSNYELSQFLGSDSPKWLTDYNSDMQKIDAGIAGVKTQADATDLVVAGHTTTIGNLNTEVTDQTTAIQNLRTQVTTNTGSINTINSLIGNGTPTTTDQTIIGAINELHAEIGGGTAVTAQAVTYDNTSSGLTATNVQAAIDEVVNAIPSVVSNTEVQRGTLAAGSTTLTLTFVEQTIGTDTLIDWYVSDPLVNPTAITTTSTTIVFTFEAQAAAISVAAKIQN